MFNDAEWWVKQASCCSETVISQRQLLVSVSVLGSSWSPRTGSQVSGLVSAILSRGGLMWKGLCSCESYISWLLFCRGEEGITSTQNPLAAVTGPAFMEVLVFLGEHGPRGTGALPWVCPLSPEPGLQHGGHSPVDWHPTLRAPLSWKDSIQPRLYPQWRWRGLTAVLKVDVHQTTLSAGLSCEPTEAFPLSVNAKT